MSSGRGDEFRSSPNMMPSVSSTVMLTDIIGANDIMNGGLVVIKQEPSSLQDYNKSLNANNYNNSAAQGCNMLQKVPSLSDLSDPENSLGT